jgi:rod shape-determining protein MreD
LKRIALYLLLGICLGFLQISVLPRLLPETLKPDLLFILVLYLGLTEDSLRGGLLSGFLGFLEDVFAGADFGLFGLTFLLIFFLVRAGANRFNTDSYALLLILTFVATFFKGAVLITLLLLFAEAGRQWPLVLAQLPAEAFLNTLSAVIMLKLTAQLRSRPVRGEGFPEQPHLDDHYES